MTSEVNAQRRPDAQRDFIPPLRAHQFTDGAYNPTHTIDVDCPWDQVGAYEIVSLIGAGGMGEVYKSIDTRLQLTVAMKVLPELFSMDEERLARFDREALASLITRTLPRCMAMAGRDNLWT